MKKMLLTLGAMLIAVGALAQDYDDTDFIVVSIFVNPAITVVADHVDYGDISIVDGVTSVLAWPYWRVTSNAEWTFNVSDLVGNVGGPGVLDGWFWNPDAHEDENYGVFNPGAWPGVPGEFLMALELKGEWGPAVPAGEKSVTATMNVWLQ